ncbi:MAG: hypothetical protein ACI9G1_002597 [Pirellulaceae bacterium]|jgi:hypothetical protein
MQSRQFKLSALVVILLGILTTSFAQPNSAFALGGKLDSPGVAFSSNYLQAAQKQVMAALERKECKFVSGSFVNWFTTLRYAGDTNAVNLMANDLAKCPGTTVTVTFKRLDEKCDWTLFHVANENSIHIQINLNSQQIDIEKFTFSAKGPKLKSEFQVSPQTQTPKTDEAPNKSD